MREPAKEQREVQSPKEDRYGKDWKEFTSGWPPNKGKKKRSDPGEAQTDKEQWREGCQTKLDDDKLQPPQ